MKIEVNQKLFSDFIQEKYAEYLEKEAKSIPEIIAEISQSYNEKNSGIDLYLLKERVPELLKELDAIKAEQQKWVDAEEQDLDFVVPSEPISLLSRYTSDKRIKEETQ